MNNTSSYKRANAVKAYNIIDSLPEESYDNITRLASFICNAPVAIISFIDFDKQYNKSIYGADFKISSIKNSMCYYAIQQEDEITIFENTLKNTATKNNPHVVAEPHIGFYAGVPIKTPEGTAIGTLCVQDFKPNSLNDKQIESLKSLARQVEHLLNLRKSQFESEIKRQNNIDDTNRLNNILHAIRVGTWEWNLKTGKVTINERYAEMIGYTLEELTPFTVDTWFKILHPDDHKLAEKAIKECFDDESAFYDFECRLLHKDGHIVWVNDSGKVIKKSETGEPLLVMGTHTDITNKKNTELRLQNITNNIPGVVFRYFRNSTGNDKLLQISEGSKNIWGFTPDEILNDNMLVWDRIHRDDVATLIKSIELAYNNFGYWNHEWRYLHPNGEIRWHKGGGNPSKVDDDTLVWDCFLMDITDRKKSENKLNSALDSLTERTKEINCLYEVTRLSQESLTINELLKKVVEIMPSGLKYPELAKVTVKYDAAIYKSPGYKHSKIYIENHNTTDSGKTLSLIVAYPPSVFKTNQSPFIKEEVDLLKSISNSLVIHINQIETGKQKELILETTVEGIYGIDNQGFCTFINSAATAILGYSREECLGKNMHELIHFKEIGGTVISEVDCPIYKALHTKKGCMIEDDVFWKKDGTGIPVRYTSTPIIQDKKIKGAVVVFSDITEKKKADLQIRANEKRFKALVQESSDLISILDRDGFYKYVSPTSKKVLGLDANYLLGKNVKDFIHPDDWATLNSKFSLLEKQKQIITQPFRYKNKEGEWRWIETTATNLLDEPTVEGIVTNSRDITERLKQEKELWESHERYRIINLATNDAIYDWNISNDNFIWGEGFEKLFGHSYSTGSFKLNDWIKLTHPRDLEKLKNRWETFIADKEQTTWENQFRFLKSDGTFAYVEELGIVIMDPNGKAIRMIGTLRDKTNTKIAELQKQVEFEVANFFKLRNHKLSKSLEKTIEYLIQFTGFDIAEIWLTSTNQKHLNLYQTSKHNQTAKSFYKLTKQVNRFKKGEGIPGTVWKLNTIQIWDNIDTLKKYTRNEAAKITGLKSAIGFPLSHNQNTIGVLVFKTSTSTKDFENFIKIFEPLGNYLGAEIKRKQQEEEIQLFFDNAPEIMAVADSNGYFIKVNPVFCKLMGYTREELTSQPFQNFLHPDDLNSTKKEYEVTISGKRLANSFINRYRTKNGDYRWISWSSSEVHGEDGLAYAYGRDISDLIELQRLFENTAKLAKIGSWELDLRDSASNNNVYWSSMTREVMEVDEHYNPTNSAGLEFCLGEHKRNLSKAVQNLIKTGEPFDLELQILSGKGNLKWVRCIGESERIDDKCIKVFGSYQDINQRKQAEIKARETLAERNNILESIGDAFFAVDLDWHVTYWNNKAEELLLTKKENIIGKKLWDVFAAHVGLKSYNLYNKAFKYQEVVHFEDYYPENDSWLEVSAYPSKAGLSVYFKDITERKRQEKTIRDSHERFEKITEATNDAIWDFDVVNNTLFWGKGYENQFGYKLDEFKPSLEVLISLIHPEDRNLVAKKIQKFMSDGVSTNWFEEYRFKKADGTYAFVIDRAIFIRNQEGNVTRVLGAMTDISYRKEYEESLKHLNSKLKRHTKELQISNQELEQFAYVTSHDLQEPLRMISSFMLLLEKKYGDKLDEKALEYIYYAVDGAKRMKKIILDLLEFSKVGRFNEIQEIVDTKELIDEYCLLRKKLISEKKVTIQYENLPEIKAYRAPLTQIFNNLLDNSIKYSKNDTPPLIQITATENQNNWEFAVKDNGIGIEAEYFKKIFIIFQRLHNKDTYEGTGMGLAIVKKIIETLDGKIWVTSQPGEGSTFYFTIPKNG